MFNNEKINVLKLSLDTIEVAQILGLIPVKKGRNFWVLCPLHEEKTASMILYPGNRGYHCKGCGRSGDAIDLFARVRRISMKQAVNELFDYYNGRGQIINSNVLNQRIIEEEKFREKQMKQCFYNKAISYYEKQLMQFSVNDIDNLPQWFYPMVEIKANIEAELELLYC